MRKQWYAAGLAAWLFAAGSALAAAAPDSQRLAHAKDYIADEQWARAIVELQAAASDPKETNRAEALFWLAHSEHQAGDDAAAIQAIARLEREYPRSPWVRIAGSMRVEIAQRLRRDDVLWRLAVPPPPPPAPRPGSGMQPASSTAITPAPPAPYPAPAPMQVPQPRPPAASPPEAPTPAAVRPPAAGRGRMLRPRERTAPGATPALPALAAGEVAPTPMAAATPVPAGTEFWLPGGAYMADTDLRIEALGRLIESHGDRAIPLLKDIALDRNSPDEARRAVFVLAQSSRPEARRTVIEVARVGAEPVRLAAIREIGRFDGPSVSSELMRVYSIAATPRVKRQVVTSLGERADSAALLRIARSEADTNVRNIAIVTLGRTGARDQLRTLYGQARESRLAVLTALFNAKDDDGLIRIARTEQEPVLRARARQQLRLLATPRALKFLDENP